MFDVIPDLHADADRLEATLAALGPAARPAFLGDFIDGKGAGADDDAVLRRVRGLVDSGAPAVMGNHELNAILFHTQGEDGPLRRHEKKNLDQHASFIARFGTATEEARHWTDWFLTLPLWRDLGGLRLVHACWSDATIATVAARRPDGRLKPEDLPEVAADVTEFAQAVNRLVSGPEVKLPEGHSFLDNSKHRRTHVRIAWWRSEARTWRDAALSVPDPDTLPDTPLPDVPDIDLYPQDAPPVLVGHYKMKGELALDSDAAACLDYPDAPCAYRWRGETGLHPGNLLAI